MELQFSAKTDIGLKRKVNEDCVYVNEQLGLCAVADGMGGHSAGDVASRMVIDIIEESFSEFEPTDEEAIKESINETIQLANYAVKTSASQNSEQRGMGSTITLLLFHENRYFIAQVGDSRAYLIRNNQIHQITEDHSLVQQELERGLITEEEAESHVFKNIITRAVGIKDEVEVDFYSDHILEGDIFLICTDGLTNKVSNLDILKEMTAGKTLDSITSGLIELANLRDGSDNISLVIIKVGVSIQNDFISTPRKSRMPILFAIPLALLLLIGIGDVLYRYLLKTPALDIKHIAQHNELTPTTNIESRFDSTTDTENSPSPESQSQPTLESLITETSATTHDVASRDNVFYQTATVTPISERIPDTKSTISVPIPTLIPEKVIVHPTETPPPQPTIPKTVLAKPSMGDRYNEGLKAYKENSISAASTVWNNMLFETKMRYTLQLQVNSLEKSVQSAFENYGEYDLFVLKKNNRYYVCSGLFPNREAAQKAIAGLPNVLQDAGPIIKTLEQVRIPR